MPNDGTCPPSYKSGKQRRSASPPCFSFVTLPSSLRCSAPAFEPPTEFFPALTACFVPFLSDHFVYHTTSSAEKQPSEPDSSSDQQGWIAGVPPEPAAPKQDRQQPAKRDHRSSSAHAPARSAGAARTAAGSAVQRWDRDKIEAKDDRVDGRKTARNGVQADAPTASNRFTSGPTEVYQHLAR